MERLSDTAIEIINELHTERLDYYSEYIPLIDAANRLAAYEDTGLEPEDLKKAFNETAILKLAAQALSTTPDHLCGSCAYGNGEWKDDGICFACREQVWIPGKPHRQVGNEKSHTNCAKMDLEG